jgi:chromosome segregation protein
VERREAIARGLEIDRNREQDSLNRIEREFEKTTSELRSQQKQQADLKGEGKTVFDERLSLERGIAENESTISLCQQLLKEAAILEPSIRNNEGARQLKLVRPENLRELVENSSQNLSKLMDKVKENQAKMLGLEESTEKVADGVLDNRIQLALLEYRRENASKDLERITTALKDAKANVNTVTVKAEQSGARIVVLKSVGEILDEIKLTDGHLAALADVSEEIERMYESYSKLYLDLKEKAQVVTENREKTLEEVKVRMASWRTVMQNLINRVNLEYQRIMNQALAMGEVKLSDTQDIEMASLEILVGFKGAKPMTLDSHTQSGGERTTATMSFLLALQQHVRSPFRAVDEYDIHMDPKNREMIAKMLLAIIKEATTQYVVITPSQITFAQENAHVITVQSIEGKSVVREVA